MESKTKGIVKSSMVLYHLGYTWTYDGGQKWDLRNEKGAVVYSISKECFPPQGRAVIDFVKKSVMLLPNVFDGEDFNIIFDMNQMLSSRYGSDYDKEIGNLKSYDSILDYSNAVINKALGLMFGE